MLSLRNILASDYAQANAKEKGVGLHYSEFQKPKLTPPTTYETKVPKNRDFHRRIAEVGLDLSMKAIQWKVHAVGVMMVLLISLSTEFGCAATVLLTKQFGEDLRISVALEERRFNPDSAEAKELAHSILAAALKRSAGEVVRDPYIPPILGWKKLTLAVQPSGAGLWSPVWTNTLCLFAGTPASLDVLRPFDAAFIGNRIHLCYRQGSAIFVEQIPVPPSPRRSRFHLTRDSGIPA